MKTKQAFTLIELLVVMVLLAILSAMTAVMLSGAKSEALAKKTRRQVDVVEQIMMSRISEMGFNPVPLVLPVANGTPVDNAGRLRLLARRDQMRMSFPDRRADLLHPPTALKYWNGTAWSVTKIRPPAAWARMRVKVGLDRPSTLPGFATEIGQGETLPSGTFEVWGLRNTADTSTHIAGPAPAAGTPELPPGADPSTYWTLEHESAECLYLILSVTEFNGIPALDLLGKQFIDNSDDDLVPEIVDAWGQPVGFVRWPIGAPFQDIQGAGPDAFDYLRSDHRFNETTLNTANDPINLTPMIVSSGRDRELGVRLTNSSDEAVSRLFSFATTFYSGSTLLGTTPTDYFYPDPYYNAVDGNNNIIDARSGKGLGGTTDAEAAADNITNFGS